MIMPQRVLCRYDGKERGPLLICLGGIHGNEPAGIQAIDIVATLLEAEPSVNPDFTFRGRLLGLTGNVQAIASGQRFMQRDLNRAFQSERVALILEQPRAELYDEDQEVFDLVSVIRKEIDDYKPEKVVVLDIHSTSAAGGIFVITSEEHESIRIGTELHAPVILDFAREVNGTTLGYFTQSNFEMDIVTVVFECGQHSEPLSVNRAIAAIINCMRTIGCVSPDSVENKHDKLLREFSDGLPKVARLVERFGIPVGTSFKMAKPYNNFAPVVAGEVVAFVGESPVRARHSGLILLPRLQDQGDDGFFIVRPVSS